MLSYIVLSKIKVKIKKRLVNQYTLFEKKEINLPDSFDPNEFVIRLPTITPIIIIINITTTTMITFFLVLNTVLSLALKSKWQKCKNLQIQSQLTCFHLSG